MLYARIDELNNLPFGGITYEELDAEVNKYRNVDIEGFGNCIETYGNCIVTLGEFYENSTPEEKKQVPNFWTESSGLWILHSQLWTKRSELYIVVSELWTAGQSKINWENEDGEG
ncbi:MAG TPA: hypothetical protein GXX20_09625 [Clostridiaceae bacterium]|nr:hypothetical protein [Clostridiaceae bacterium]